MNIEVLAWTQQVGDIACSRDWQSLDLSLIEENDVRCPDPDKAKQMADLIMQVKAEGDTIGGVIAGVIKGCPVGLGEPAFGKLHAMLGSAMLSINAVKGFEYGEGFEGVSARGSEQNDVFQNIDGQITTKTNHSGGIQGGISNGQDIYFRVAFKPVATILMNQETIDKEGNPTKLQVKGRHDPCVLPRAVPIVEAMAAMTILDYYLLKNSVKW
jgi:chorismate synthase